MNTKIKSIKFFAIAIMALLSINAWGDTHTATFGSGGTYKGYSTSNNTASANGVTWTLGGGYASSYVSNDAGFLHVGSGSKAIATLTLSTSDIAGTITSVVVNAKNSSGTSTALSVMVGGTNLQCNANNSVDLSTTASDYAFTGSASGAIVVTASQNSAKKAIYVASITVTYSAGGSSACATPTFSLSAGSYCGEQSVTISCTTDGATIHYTTDGSTPTSSSTTYSSSISVSSSQTIKAIAVKGGLTDSEVASASYTIESPLSTADAIFSAATTAGSTATQKCVTFTNWVITGVSGSNAYITDGAGKGAIIYQSGHGFAVGDKLNGTVSCKVQLYKGAAEFTSLTASTDGLTVTNDGAVSPIVQTIDNLSGIHTGAVYTIQGVTYNSSTQKLSDTNSNEIKPFTTLYSGTFSNGTEYNVTGVYFHYDANPKEILPRSAADIVEASSPNPCETSLSTVDAIFAVAEVAGNTPTERCVTFTNWVVTGVKSGNAYVTDGAGKGLIIYKAGLSSDFAVGDVLNGTVSGVSVELHEGSAQLFDVVPGSNGLTVTTGGTVSPITMSISDLTALNTGAVITLNNVTYHSSLDSLQDAGGNTIGLFKGLYNDMSFTDGASYNVTGVYLYHNVDANPNKREVLPRSAEDISLIVDPKTVNFISDHGASASPSLTEASAGAGVTLPSCTANTGWEFIGWSTTSNPSSADAGVAGETFHPASDGQYLYAYFKQYRTVTFLNNGNPVTGGDRNAQGEKIYYNGDQLGTLPVLTSGDACDATSTTFIGWTSGSAISVKQNSAPALVTSSTVVNSDLTLRAVWAKEQ